MQKITHNDFIKKFDTFTKNDMTIKNERYGNVEINEKTGKITFNNNGVVLDQITFHTHPFLNKNRYYSFFSITDIRTIINVYDTIQLKSHIILHQHTTYVFIFSKIKEKTMFELKKIEPIIKFVQKRYKPSVEADKTFYDLFNNNIDKKYIRMHIIFKDDNFYENFLNVIHLLLD